MADVPRLDQRRGISDRQTLARIPTVAPIVGTSEPRICEQSCFDVCFEAPGTLTLKDILADDDHAKRLRHVAAVLRQLPGWWARFGAGFVPMPADIVFENEQPFLMGIPSLGWWPRFESLIESNARLSFLAPEIVRGNSHLVLERNLDIYACGMAALFSLYHVPMPGSPWELLEQAAANLISEGQLMISRLPFWMERAKPHEQACRLIRAALSPDPRLRGEVDTIRIAEALERLAQYVDPTRIVRDLRASGAAEPALHMVTDICLHENRQDILILGAEIAGQDLGRPIEAIEFYERALGRGPGPTGLMSAQLKLLLENVPTVFIESLLGKDAGVGNRLDGIAWRDFHALPMAEKRHYADGAGVYFLVRRKYHQAATILYAHIYDESTFLWWEIERSLLYVAALLGLGEVDGAGTFLDGVRQSLTRLHAFPPQDPRHLSADKVGAFGSRIVALDAELQTRRKMRA
jgi:hypothetical protein